MGEPRPIEDVRAEHAECRRQMDELWRRAVRLAIEHDDHPDRRRYRLTCAQGHLRTCAEDVEGRVPGVCGVEEDGIPCLADVSEARRILDTGSEIRTLTTGS